MHKIVNWFKLRLSEYEIPLVVTIPIFFLGLIMSLVLSNRTILLTGIISIGIWVLSYVANLVIVLVTKKLDSATVGIGCIMFLSGYLSFISAAALSFHSIFVALATLLDLGLIAYEITTDEKKKEAAKETKLEREGSGEETIFEELHKDNHSMSKHIFWLTVLLLLNVVVRSLPFLIFILL